MKRDVFIVCNNFEELGGLQTWAHHMGRLFAGRGHRVRLVGITHAETPHDHGRDFPYATTVLHRRPPRGRGRRAGRERARAADRLAGLLRHAAPGGVVIAAQVWAMEWVAAAGPCGLPVIGMSHESYGATRGSSRYRRVRRFYADVDRFLVLTDADADAWARDRMTNVAAMPNPLPVAPRRHAALDAPVVVRLGRLAEEKGQDMLLDAWETVAAACPGWTLRLYGSGPMEAELRGRAPAGVEFAGPTSDIEGALVNGSVFALTSREEGFPMSVMEAMAYGVPCVAFDCAPGIRELITDGVDGIVVPPGHTGAFADALRGLIEDGPRRRAMGAEARRSVRRFSPDTVLDRWERLFWLLEQ